MTRLHLLGLGIAAIMPIAGCAHEESPPPVPTAVRDEIVGTSGDPGAPRYSAAILPANRVDVAFRVPGYIASLEQVRDGAGQLRPLQEGDRVQQGQTLATLRPDDFDAKLNQAKSQHAEAQAALAQASLAYERASGLYERKSLTRADYDAAKAARDTLVAKEAGAQALVDEAQNAHTDSSLRSPLTGVVLKRLVEVGSFTAPGVPTFVIADTSSVKIPFGAPDSVVRRLSLQQPVTVTTPAYPNTQFRGRITSLAPAADPGSLVFDVEVTVPNRDGRLKPGMVASLNVPGEQHGAGARLTVPLTAIVRSKAHPDGYALYVVETRDGGTYARIREVTLGEMVATGVTVTAGLREGEHVIVSGATIVTDGEAIQLVR